MRRAVDRAKVRAGGSAESGGAESGAAVSAAAAVATGTGPTRTLIWRLQAGGWTPVEAGNLAAIALGLRPVGTGWTGAELDHLRFLRSLVSAGRIER